MDSRHSEDVSPSKDPSPTLPVQIDLDTREEEDERQKEHDERLLQAFEKLRARSKSPVRRNEEDQQTSPSPAPPVESDVETAQIDQELDEKFKLNAMSPHVEPMKPAELTFKVPPAESLQELTLEVNQITEKLMESNPPESSPNWRNLIQQESQSVVGALRRNPRWSLSAAMERQRNGDPVNSFNATTAYPTYPPDYYYQKIEVKQESENGRLSTSSAPRLSTSSARDSIAPMSPLKEPNQPSQLASLLTEERTDGKTPLPPLPLPPCPRDGGGEDSPLLHNFIILKNYLLNEEDQVFEYPDPLLLLMPFVEVVRSGDTTGTITGSALTSLSRILSLDSLPTNHASLPAAMRALVHASTHCKFEATDSISDEVVLGKILTLIRDVVRSSAGRRALDDRACCEAVEAGLGMCFQGRVSELLRKSAEDTLGLLVRFVFGRIHASLHLRRVLLQTEAIRLTQPAQAPTLSPKVESPETQVATTQFDTFRPCSLPSALEILRVLAHLLEPSQKSGSRETNHKIVALSLISSCLDAGASSNALRSWNEVGWTMEQLEKVSTNGVSLIPNQDDKECQQLSSMALAFLQHADPDHALHAPLHTLVTSTIPRLLFNTLHSLDKSTTINHPPSSIQLTLIQLALRCCSSLVTSLRGEMRQVVEYLIRFIIGRCEVGVMGVDVVGNLPKIEDENVSRPPSAVSRGSTDKEPVVALTPPPNKEEQRPVQQYPITGEVRELMLESLAQLCKIPTFFVELYINSDGNLKTQSHMFEELIQFLAKHVFPDTTPGGPVTTTSHQRIALECLISLLASMDTRAKHRRQAGELKLPKEFPSAQQVVDSKERKRLLAFGAEQFNMKPANGIAFLQRHNFLPTPTDPQSLAETLATTPRISKKLLGEYLSKPVNIDVLKAFINRIDFRGKRLDEALRVLLESFRLPGESQQIERIMETFAAHYFSTIQKEELHKNDIATEDATFVLSYSIIMLNTDQHNPQVRGRMTFEQFTRNTRGLNDGKDFAPEYLQKIYDAIRETEIVMPEEHQGELGFQYAWKELMQNADTHGTEMLVMESDDVGGDEVDPQQEDLLFAGLLDPQHLGIHARTRESLTGKWLGEGGQEVWATDAYDKDMLQLVWAPVLASVTYALDSAEDDATLQRAGKAVGLLASLAERHSIPGLLDQILVSLSRVSSLLQPCERGDVWANRVPGLHPAPPATTWEKERAKERMEKEKARSQREGNDKHMVSFGRSPNAQLATALLFRLAGQYSTNIKDSWRCVLECMGKLFLHGGLSNDLALSEDFVRGMIQIAKVLPLDYPAVVGLSPNLLEARSGDASPAPDASAPTLIATPPTPGPRPDRTATSLFSTVFTQLTATLRGSLDEAWGNNDVPPSEEEIKAHRLALEVLKRLNVEELWNAETLTKLDDDSSKSLGDALISVQFADSWAGFSNLPERTNPQSTTLPRVTKPPSPHKQRLSADGREVVQKESLPLPIVQSNTPKLHPATGLYISLLTSFLGHNAHRIFLYSDDVKKHLLETLLNGHATLPSSVLERAAVGALKVALKILQNPNSDNVSIQLVVDILDRLRSLPGEALVQLAPQVMMASLVLAKTCYGSLAKHSRVTDSLIQLIAKCTSVSALGNQNGQVFGESNTAAFDAVCLMLQPSPNGTILTPKNFGEFVDVLSGFASASGVLYRSISSQPQGSPPFDRQPDRSIMSWGFSQPSQPSQTGKSTPKPDEDKLKMQKECTERAIRSLEVMYTLENRVPAQDAESAWYDYHLPLLAALSQQVYHPSKEVRSVGVTLLSRLVMGDAVATCLSTPGLERAPYTAVLFPLLDELLKPEFGALDSSVDETRIRASALLSKKFLQDFNTAKDKSLDQVVGLWGHVVEYLLKFIKLQHSELLREAVTESLKNMLLVLSTQNVLSPQEKEGLNLWNETWYLIDPVIPALKAEVFPQ